MSDAPEVLFIDCDTDCSRQWTPERHYPADVRYLRDNPGDLPGEMAEALAITAHLNEHGYTVESLTALAKRFPDCPTWSGIEVGKWANEKRKAALSRYDALKAEKGDG